MEDFVWMNNNNKMKITEHIYYLAEIIHWVLWAKQICQWYPVSMAALVAVETLSVIVQLVSTQGELNLNADIKFHKFKSIDSLDSCQVVARYCIQNCVCSIRPVFVIISRMLFLSHLFNLKEINLTNWLSCAICTRRSWQWPKWRPITKSITPAACTVNQRSD